MYGELFFDDDRRHAATPRTVYALRFSIQAGSRHTLDDTLPFRGGSDVVQRPVERLVCDLPHYWLFRERVPFFRVDRRTRPLYI